MRLYLTFNSLPIFVAVIWERLSDVAFAFTIVGDVVIEADNVSAARKIQAKLQHILHQANGKRIV